MGENMTTISTTDAQRRLPELLVRVANGERIVLTTGGTPVAMLVPPEISQTDTDAARVGREMLAYRDTVKRNLDGSFRDLAHEGHR